MTSVYNWLVLTLAKAKDEEGQTMAEYGIILAVIVVVAVGAFALIGTNLKTTVTDVAGNL